MDYDDCWKEDPNLPNRIGQIYREVGILKEEGDDTALWDEFTAARNRGDLPPVTDATSADDYVEKTRMLLSAWAHSERIVESETFEAKLSRRLQIRKTDVRPHEQAVLSFPNSPPDAFEHS